MSASVFRGRESSISARSSCTGCITSDTVGPVGALFRLPVEALARLVTLPAPSRRDNPPREDMCVGFLL